MRALCLRMRREGLRLRLGMSLRLREGLLRLLSGGNLL